jgi:hypothetical protein
MSIQLSKEQKKKAAEIARKHKVDTVFVNDKNEYFTQQNLVELSVNGDKEKYGSLSLKSYSEPAVTGDVKETKTKSK